MIHIQKNSPPSEFINFIRQTPQIHFDDIPSDIKEILRKSLLEEQGYLCAYCMSRIDNDHSTTKIEHYRARDNNNELDYSNLLAVCTGNSFGKIDGSYKHQHCDTRKGEKSLNIDPQNAEHIAMIDYKSDGTIFSRTNPQFNDDFNKILNLNDDNGYLKFNRKTALRKFQEKIHNDFKDKTAKVNYLKKALNFYSSLHDGRRTEYCGIILHYIEKKLKTWDS